MQSRIPICRICSCPGRCLLTTSPVRLQWPLSVRFATSKRTHRPVRCVSPSTKLQEGTTHHHGVGRRAQVSYLPAQPYTRSSLVSCLYLCSVRLPIIFLELLVDVVDVILEDSGIDEKFLGITLFALVPNTTEFMNAISFALNGNIALRLVK